MNVLVKTLDDNWSQVRMSASVLCRTFLLSLDTTQSSSRSTLFQTRNPTSQNNSNTKSNNNSQRSWKDTGR